MTAGNRFAGKALLATGGGSGLAAATARRFAAEGGRVAVLDLDGVRRGWWRNGRLRRPQWVSATGSAALAATSAALG